MRRVAASEFKARCLKMMDQVDRTNEPIIITKRGRPVAKLVPAGRPSRDILGCLAGVIEIVGDIESPVVAPETWEALR
jgi:prevent-host-death family protein